MEIVKKPYCTIKIVGENIPCEFSPNESDSCRRTEFISELAELLNSFNMDTEANTPDYILAQYLLCCLNNFTHIVNARDDWFGFVPYGGLKKVVE